MTYCFGNNDVFATTHIMNSSNNSSSAQPKQSPELLDQSALSLSAAIHSKALSCLELMQATLAQIDRYNPAYNAVISLKPAEQLLDQARDYDALLAKGHSLGWLHGIPQAIKDLAATKDILTTKGSPLYAKNQPVEDALMVSRMREAGAIIIGKTNTPEFGLGSQTYNPLFGATRNAWHCERTSGGSSGGAAVALALRILPVADGSDMGGSLRNPAAWNHVFGMRPSQGRVPKWPAPESFFAQLGTEGPMGRHVVDVARLLATQSGYDARSPLSLDQTFRPLIDQATQAQQAGEEAIEWMRSKRMGWLGDLNAYLPMQDGVLRCCEEALKAYSSMGVKVKTAKFNFDPARAWDAWLKLRHAIVSMEVLPFLNDPSKRDLLKAEARWEAEEALKLSAVDLMQASVERSAFYQAWLQLFDHYDFLILPTAQCFPFDVHTPWPSSIGSRTMDSYHRWMEVVIYATLSGCPSISVPAGWGGPEHLPMGIQIIGRPRADFDVLRAAHAYELAQSAWIHKKPPALTE
jgi:amidase